MAKEICLEVPKLDYNNLDEQIHNLESLFEPNKEYALRYESYGVKIR